MRVERGPGPVDPELVAVAGVGSVKPSFVPAVKPGFARVDVGHEAVVWARSSPTATYLDPVARVLLDVVDGTASLAQLAQEVHEEVGVTFDVAFAQVARCVAHFEDHGLLASSTDAGLEFHHGLFASPPST